MRDYLPNFKVGVSKQDTALIIEEQIKHSLYEILCKYIHTRNRHTYMYTNRHVQGCSFSIIHNSKKAVTQMFRRVVPFGTESGKDQGKFLGC